MLRPPRLAPSTITIPDMPELDVKALKVAGELGVESKAYTVILTADVTFRP
jgi:hypothetical protein